METKANSRKLSITVHCFTFGCIIFNLFFTVYVFIDLQRLRQSYAELQQSVADNTLQIQENTELNNLNADNTEKAKTLSRQGRQLTAHNMIADLIHAQEHILQTHCANNSRLCMQGPKGEKGDTGSPGPSANTSGKCTCLLSPTIHSGNATQQLSPPTVLDCSATGSPAPFITWFRDGVRIYNKQTQNITVTTPGNYSCTAENIVGVATSFFHVT